MQANATTIILIFPKAMEGHANPKDANSGMTKSKAHLEFVGKVDRPSAL